MLWILSEVFYPEETGTGYYISRIGEHLAQKRPVSALCAQPAYSRAGVIAPRKETHGNVKIFRCPSLVLNQRSIPMRLMRMVSITCSMFFAALFRIRRGDTILAVTNPPSVPILAVVLSFILRVPYSLLVHDVYPEIIAACGLTSRKAVSFRILQEISRVVLRRAETVFCIGRDMAEHLARLRGTGNNNGINIIPLWSDCAEIQPAPRSSNHLLLKLGLIDKLVVLYAGNMGHPHDIETLAAAIKQLEPDEGIHFLFIGSGPKRNLIQQMIASGSKNITLLEPRPRSDQNEFLNACDVAILSLVPGMLGLAVPSRTYNLMAAGKPIIALVSRSSEVALVIGEEEIGWVVEPGQVDKVVQALQAAERDPKRLSEMGARARRAAETEYSPDSILNQFESAFQQ